MAQEATAVNDQAAQDAATDSATVESEAPDVDELEAAFDDGESFESEAESDDSEEEESAEETEEKPQTKADKRKEQLEGEIQSLKEEAGIDKNREIRDLVSARNALRETVQQANAQVYQPATENELMQQGMSPEMAAIEAMKQSMEMQRYNDQVAEVQLTLSSDADKALRDFPMFDSDSKDYSPELAAQVDQLLGANLVFDPNTGQVIGSHVPVYQLYKSFADATRISQAKGQADGQRSTEKMFANADVSGNAHQTVKSDPGLDGFDEEARRY